MKKLFYIFLTILFCINITGCNDSKETVVPTTTAISTTNTTVKKSKKVTFPIDIQFDFCPPTYFCRIEEDGTVLLKRSDGCGYLDGDPSKVFDEQVKINEDSTKEKISTDVSDRIKDLATELTKVETYHWAVDCPNAFIYFEDETMMISIIKREKSYKYIEEIIDLLNEYTSLDIDDKYY